MQDWVSHPWGCGVCGVSRETGKEGRTQQERKGVSGGVASRYHEGCGILREMGVVSEGKGRGGVVSERECLSGGHGIFAVSSCRWSLGKITGTSHLNNSEGNSSTRWTNWKHSSTRPSQTSRSCDRHVAYMQLPCGVPSMSCGVHVTAMWHT